MVEPRLATPTVAFVDEYCQFYQSLFPEVRSFEAFKFLHLGMIADIKRKSLPAIARAVGLENHQGLHHFLTHSPWSAVGLRQRRLELILQVLNGRSIVLIVDDTGDVKKGKTTDYVKRQYIGNIGKIENGIVAVTAYGLVGSIPFPLIAEVFKPKDCLKPGDEFKTKPQIAGQMVRELVRIGFRIDLVLADRFYGESDYPFLRVLRQFKLPYVVAIRNNHGVLMPRAQRVRYNRWHQFKRTFSNGDSEIRYIREIIFGNRRQTQYWEITTDPETLPGDTTGLVMTHVAEINYREVGDLYGLRTWVEYGIKQSKSELGWADFRLTEFTQIEKWWEVVMSAFLLVSLYSEQLTGPTSNSAKQLAQHPWWNSQSGWKNWLNNLRLVIQPFICFNLIKPWLLVFANSLLSLGFPRLIEQMNSFRLPKLLSVNRMNFRFSSA
ncbi:MAG: IS701 family transposase [Chroococcidiopsidaceae cyanobacterium CP_BM_ER_R8_30]|nr:IS701 family transposase [Chroococcidiopsidaceae cyanobacterium CP_BM_ER_R8_30]